VFISVREDGAVTVRLGSGFGDAFRVADLVAKVAAGL
jgi:hypothetical protein